MATYTVDFYAVDPNGRIPNSGSFVWNGPATYNGTATITDNEPGIQGYTLDDDNAGGETATGTVTTAAGTSTNSTLDAEIVWTVTDTVTGQTFQVAQLDVEQGAATGFYTLSEQPLIAGRTYTVQAVDTNSNVAAGDIAFSFRDYTNGVIEGTSGADLINPSYVDRNGESPDDSIGTSADSIVAGDGNDTVMAGQGNDTVTGDAGNDLIYGDYGTYTPSGIAQDLNWNFFGPSGTNIANGAVQDTGDIDVTLGFVSDGNNTPTFQVDTSLQQYHAAGETYSNTSSLFLYGLGDGPTSTTTLTFNASAGAAVQNSVQNVSFRINDVDWGAGNHTDIITVLAYDINGNPVPVTFGLGGNDTLNGNTVTAGQISEATSDAGGSLLITVAGPVHSIAISYANGQANTQGIWLTDVQFNTIPVATGNDSLSGGAGNDTIFGEAGNDTLDGGADNDSLNGGDGNDSILGGTGNDAIDGGAGNDTIYGGDGLDTIWGGLGSDLIDGGLGADAIAGGDGQDTILGQDGDDLIWGDGGADSILGGTGNDTIDAGTGNDTVLGGDGNDVIWGGDGNDSIDGGIGDDAIAGGTGNDTILGGDGNDWIAGEAGADSISGGAGNDSLDGGADNDTLLGGDGADAIWGGTGDDSIDAGTGADVVAAGDGNDTVLGGDGNDLLWGEAGNDYIDGGAGNDTLEGGAGADTFVGGSGMDYVSYTTSASGVTVNLATNTFSGGDAEGDSNAWGVDGIIGSAFGDNLTGYDGMGYDAEGLWTNIIYGGAGNDTISGLSGDDSLYGDDGDDYIDGGADNDYLSGGIGNDTLLGGTGNDTLDAGTGADSLDGGEGNDSILAGGGNDTVYGGFGNDTVEAGNGNDLVYGGEGNDSLLGDGGNDSLIGEAGDDYIAGGAGDDILWGGSGADTLDGGDGNDLLYGDVGPDLLLGGAGNDLIYATAGDTIDAGDGDDTITLVDVAESGTIFIEGSTTGQAGGDTLDLAGLADRTTLNFTTDPNGEMTGTIMMFNGTLVSFSNIDSVVCFTPGTRILTPTGYLVIDDLVAGDLVMTRDDGPQPLRWKGESRRMARGKTAPVRIAPHVFPTDPALRDPRPLVVSPQHRMLIEGYETELLFGEDEVFAAATHLEGFPGITRVEGREVTYVHLALDRHQVIWAEGVATESFFVGPQALKALDDAQRAALFAVFPALEADDAHYGPTARACLKRHEAQMLMREVQMAQRQVA